MNTWTEILACFNDIFRDSGNSIFSAAQKLRFANRALQEIGAHTEYVEEYEDINTVAGTATYEITASAYRVSRVEYDGQVITPALTSDLLMLDAEYATRTGLPKFYYLDNITGDQDAITVGLYKVPSTSVTSGLRVWYSAVPTTITGATGEIEIPDWAAAIVLFYMLNIAYTAETRKRNLNTAAFYKLLYEDLLDSLTRRVNSRIPKNWKGGEEPRITVGSLSRLPDHIQEGLGAPGDFGEGFLTRNTTATATAAEVAGGSIVLYWNDPTGYVTTGSASNYYQLWRGTSISSLLDISHTAARFQGTDGVSDLTATTAGTYYYRVYSVDNNGYTGDGSDFFALTVTE